MTTAIETKKDVLVKMRAMDLTIWVWCPHCMAGHQIKPADAVLERDYEPIAPTVTERVPISTVAERPSVSTTVEKPSWFRRYAS